MSACVTVETKLKAYFFPNYKQVSLGFFDIHKSYADESRWRVKEEWRNVFEGVYFDLSNIESIIFDYKKWEIFISFIYEDSHHIKDINIKESYSEWVITLFDEKGVENNRYISRDSSFNVMYLNHMFLSLCKLDDVYETGIIVNAMGNAYQTSNLKNYYKGNEISKLDEIDVYK